MIPRRFPLRLPLLLLSTVSIGHALTCIRYYGAANSSASTCSDGSVCLVRRTSNISQPLMDCGSGSYWNRFLTGCYGNETKFCVCRSDNCNTASLISSTSPSPPSVSCHNSPPSLPNATIGSCSFCLSYSDTAGSLAINNYQCLSDPTSLISRAPFIGLCYRYAYSRGSATSIYNGTMCMCDTSLCSDGLSSIPSVPSEIAVNGSNATTQGVSCYMDSGRKNTCTGDVCFLWRSTVTGVVERGCLIHENTPKARAMLYPGVTKDVSVEYYLCSDRLCNRNVDIALSYISLVPTTTAAPVTLSPSETTNDGSTVDEWWTGSPAPNTTWNDSWIDDDNDTNSTNGTTTPKPTGGALYHTLVVPGLLVALAALLIS